MNNPKRYQNLVLWACPKFISTPKRYQFNNYNLCNWQCNISTRVGDSDIHPVLVVGLIPGCPWHHTSQKYVPLHFIIFIIFVGSESIFHGSQLRYLSMHS